MSAALERVIAEQQDVIDMLKVREDAHIKSCIYAVKREERLVRAVFAFVNKSDEKNRHALKVELSNHGYCVMCEENPCDCEGQYD